MTTRWLYKSVLLATLILIFNGHGFLAAQTAATGQIAGVVRDSSGALLPGVGVAVFGAAGIERRAMTDDSGAYVIPLLPAGNYRLEFSLTGFEAVHIDRVAVQITETTKVNALLQVAGTKQSVTVTAQTPLVQDNTATTGRVIGEKTIRELPLATRNFTQLLALSPGASASLPDNSAVGLNSLDISVNGASRFNNDFQLNGIDTNAIGLNNVFNYPVPATDSLREFKVQTSLYDASFGRNGGGQIQVITKSGSNEFHGDLYHFYRSNVLNANDFFLNSTGTPRPFFLRNQFGFTLGGPIRKDRTFFFVSYQGTRERNGAARGGNINAISSLALPPGLTNDRSPEAISQASGVPVPEIDPVAMLLLQTHLPGGGLVIPSPQLPAPGVNYTVSVPARFSEDQANLNIDHSFGPNNQVAAKYFTSWNPIDQGINLPPPGFGANVPGFGGHMANDNRNFSLAFTHIFAPDLVNEARLGYNRVFSLFDPKEPLRADSVGISRFNQSILPGIPLIGVLGSFQIGPSPIFQLRVALNTFTYADTLSYTAGRHNLRLGVELRRSQENSRVDFFQRGQILFLSFSDFVRGNIFLSLAGSGNFRRDFRNTDFDWFIQDDFKLSPRLTLNLGLRYEYDGAPVEVSGKNVTFDPAQYRTGLPPNGFVLAGNVSPDLQAGGVPLGSDTLLKDRDLNNFAPRIGFAFRPWRDRNLVIRGGYGVFYQRISNQAFLFSFAGPPFSAFSTLVFPKLFGVADFSHPFPNLPSAGDFPIVPFVPGLAEMAQGVPPISLTAVDPGLRTPYVQQFNLTIQQEFWKNFLFEVGYVGTKGTKLLRQVHINQALLASPEHPVNGITENTPLNATFRAPFLGFAPNGLIQIQSSGDSIYNSLQASLTKRLGRGLQFLASYTYSKAIDDARTSGADGDSNPVATGDQRLLFLNRGLSDFDRTHRFVLSTLYDLPAFRERAGAVGKLLSGWEIAALATLQSGTPIDITDSSGALLYGITTSRASFAPGSTVEDAKRSGSVNDRLNQYFNRAAFQAAGLEFGNAGRNILRGPDQRNLDLSLIKKTSIRESQVLEFRAEFFNIFNTVNFANPGGDISAPATFGVITSTSASPRMIQFALKYRF